MKVQNRLCLLAVICFLCFACKETRLEQAFRLAGDNRSELEHVIEHYSKNEKDSLKLKAAIFLIENMPGHYTLESELLTSYRTNIDRDTAVSYFAKKMMDVCISRIPMAEINSVHKEDVKHIKSDYLIRHIDSCFEIYNDFPWYKNIPIENFFKYVLPYRIGKERVDSWRDSVRPSLSEEYWLSSDIRNNVEQAKVFLACDYEANPQFSNSQVNQLFQELKDQCLFLNLKLLLRKRMLGIPSTIDYFPYYPNRNGLHYWVTDVSTCKRNPYIKDANNSKPAKIFRQTFDRQEVVSWTKEEYIPDLFLDPFLCDVTDEYLYTAEVVVNEVDNRISPSRYAYLCVFNHRKWEPTAIGRRKKSSAEFENMGKDIVYLPIYYQGDIPYSFNYPFILRTSGDVQYLIPDTTNLAAFRIERKHPYDEYQYAISAKFRNSYVLASNDKNFKLVDTLFRFPSSNHYYYSMQVLDTIQSYKYWKVEFLEPAYISEIVFYDKQGRALQSKYDFITMKLFDKNPLTSTTLPEVFIEFQEPVNVRRMVCLPGSDGNGIYPGEEYELFYYELDGWKSLGRKIARDYFLDYNNIPKGGLYWLRNWTKGCEERIFTIEDGICNFW